MNQSDLDDDIPALISIHSHGHSHAHGSTCCSAPQWASYYWSLWLAALPFAYIYYKGRQAYAALWVPFLFQFGLYAFEGRENAGKVAHRSRMVRGMAAVVRLAAIYLMVKSMGNSPKQFLEEGAVLPLWFDKETALDTSVYAWLAVASMTVNMIAILFASAANHHKIQQYYDKQIMLQEVSNEKNNASKTVPHGWNAPRSIFWVNAGRYVHDANGLTGTVLSSIIFMSVVCGLLGGSLGIGKATLGKLFFASSMLALLSVIFVPMTTWGRLWAHKKEIVAEMNHQRTGTNNPISTALAPVFEHIKESREKDMLYYHCVRACEHARSINKETVLDITKITAALTPYILNNRVSAEAIKSKAGEQRLCLMDALSLIETKVVMCLLGKNEQHQIQKIQDKPFRNTPAETILWEKLKSRGIINVDKLVSKEWIQAKDNEWCINKDKVAAAFPTLSNPHGSGEFVMDYHTEKMVRACHP